MCWPKWIVYDENILSSRTKNSNHTFHSTAFYFLLNVNDKILTTNIRHFLIKIMYQGTQLQHYLMIKMLVVLLTYMNIINWWTNNCINIWIKGPPPPIHSCKKYCLCHYMQCELFWMLCIITTQLIILIFLWVLFISKNSLYYVIDNKRTVCCNLCTIYVNNEIPNIYPHFIRL